ncbi:MAG: hypothetical protein J6K05_09890 [Bacteroidaceae bacterium]|nr:hypothetical protein [Bacteroidaceae bacterium]
MKLYKSFMFSALAAVAALATSCSDEGYWDAYAPESPEYSFAQSANSYSFLPSDEIPEALEVKVYRNNTNGEVQLPLVVNYSGNVFSTGNVAVFADGSNEAVCQINVSNPVIGQTESMTIAIDTTAQAYKVSPTGNIAVTLSMTLDYTWVAAGSCNYMSNFEGNTAKLNIQKAKEYDGNLYRIVSPYYYLAPNYCPNPGYHVQFYLDENYEPLELPRFQNIGEKASAGGYWTMYYNEAEEFCSFTREGTVFTINTGWVTGDADMGYGFQGNTAEIFDWNDGCPSAL